MDNNKKPVSSDTGINTYATLFNLFYFPVIIFGEIADIQGLSTSTAYLLIPLLFATIITILLPNEKTMLKQNKY